MDVSANTDSLSQDLKICQENILLEIIKEVCNDSGSQISSKLAGKVKRIIADCDLIHHTSLHKLSVADDSTSTLLGVMHQTSEELTFEEQAELNQSIIKRIQNKLPAYILELDHLKMNTAPNKDSHKDQIKELRESLDDKLNTLQEQENEKLELMMEWLNHHLYEIMTFNDKSTELLTLKTKILDLKSKILHLQILQNIFTETNRSIKAYSEVHNDLKEGIKETEKMIKNYQNIIAGDE